MKHTLKILYIFLLGVGVFFINNIWILLGIIGVHLIVLLTQQSKSLRFLWKVKWFLAIIFLFHALSGKNDIVLLQIKRFTLALSYDGLLEGSIMACKLISMLLITHVVRQSMKKKDFVKGLSGLGLQQSTAEIIDEIFDIVISEKGSGKGSGGGKGGGKNKDKKSDATDVDNVSSKDVLLKGKIGRIPERLQQRMEFAKERFANNPNAVMASSALSVTLIRMVKIAPGLPLAPGHKNILLVPVFIYGIHQSKQPFSGTKIGLISGILHFAMGFGKYGPLGILQFALLGFVIDLLMLLPVKKTNLFFLILVGAFAGLTRISSEILLATVLGMPKEFYLLYLPYIVSQIAFGAASGLITRALIKPKK